jgi:hypothetical protein
MSHRSCDLACSQSTASSISRLSSRSRRCLRAIRRSHFRLYSLVYYICIGLDRFESMVTSDLSNIESPLFSLRHRRRTSQEVALFECGTIFCRSRAGGSRLSLMCDLDLQMMCRVLQVSMHRLQLVALSRCQLPKCQVGTEEAIFLDAKPFSPKVAILVT